MKTLFKFTLTILLVVLLSAVAEAQDAKVPVPVKFKSRNLAGPRLGITFVPGNTALYESLQKENIGRVLSQFGWHFEYQIVPEIEGPCFIIEMVPLLAGVEYSKFIPAGTLAFGIRFPSGLEFGLGPNILITRDGAKTALMTSIGKSYDYGGVSIPLNLAVTSNPDGFRISFIFGYAIDKAN